MHRCPEVVLEEILSKDFMSIVFYVNNWRKLWVFLKRLIPGLSTQMKGSGNCQIC